MLQGFSNIQHIFIANNPLNNKSILWLTTSKQESLSPNLCEATISLQPNPADNKQPVVAELPLNAKRTQDYGWRSPVKLPIKTQSGGKIS